MMPSPQLLLAWRVLRLCLHLVGGVLLSLRVRLRRPRPAVVGRLAQRWHRHLLHLLGARVRVVGRPVGGGHMTVANHISWLDISVIYACEPVRFVSKSEVARWPVAGLLADAAGTFYIERGRFGSRALTEALSGALAADGALAVFPEGTTTDGSTVPRFHARLFGAAVEAQRPVQPVLLRYGPDADSRRLAPFIGDDDLISHLLRLLRNPRLQVEVVYLAPIDPAGHTRDSLAEAAHRAVCERHALTGLQPARGAQPAPLDEDASEALPASGYS